MLHSIIEKTSEAAVTHSPRPLLKGWEDALEKNDGEKS